jgi:hypothetical protein
MPFDVDRTHEFLRSLAVSPPTPSVWGPTADHLRSPAAARIATLAAQTGLRMHHFEHRAHRDLPEDWIPADRLDLGDPPRWENGVLGERKYHSFRHDQAIGGFHPGQRGKWTAHELCHALVGFAWNPKATPFFHATAGRLAELLPVTLWYFLDEAFAARCPIHTDDPALYRSYCPHCERHTGLRADDRGARHRLVEAKHFLDRELAAIAKTRRTGRPMPHLHATLDLCSDGVAYAGAHAARLRSDAFVRWAELFLVEGGGWSSTIDALEARVLDVARSFEGVEPMPLAPSAAHGAARWILQDVAWNLTAIWHDTSGDAAEDLWRVIEGLAEGIPETLGGPPPDVPALLRAAVAAYHVIEEEWVLPPTAEVFAVGYPLVDGLGSSIATLTDGVRSAMPLTADLVDLEALVPIFAERDLRAPSRAFLGERFCEFLGSQYRGALIDLARYEAAITRPGPVDANAILGDNPNDPRVRLADGLQVVWFDTDVVALAERVDDGEVGAEDGTLVGDTPIVLRRSALILGRVGDGDLLVLDVSPEAAAAIDALGDGGVLALGADEVESFRMLGILVPAAWHE